MPRVLPAAAMLLLGLAACSQSNGPLPGVRLPVREEVVAPTAGPDQAKPIAIPAAVMNAEWTHRNGASAGRLVNPALRPVPELIWSVPIGEGDARRRRILTGPIAAQGLIFTLDAGGQLTAVSRSGQIAWTKSLVPPGQMEDNGPGGGFAEADGVLYVTTGFGDVFALQPATGATIWQRTLSAPVQAAPAVADGRVIVVQRDDNGFALDARSGEILWQVQGTGGTGIMGGSSPAVNGQLAVIPFASGEVLGVLARNGLTIWGTAITGGRPQNVRSAIIDVSGAPVVDGDAIFASNQAGRTTRIDAATGERAWTMDEGSYGPAWPVGGSIFLLSDEGALVRADAATGDYIWQVSLPEWFPYGGLFGRGKPSRAVPYFGPVLAGGRIWVASGDGVLRAFSPVDGSRLVEIAIPGGAAAQPAVAGGVMYIVTTDGKLLAFQ
ncbi:outer membrane protein assembly factor BamB [Amaricoccus macauensis]|uniref:Outer membrane protein assembly factor BamB n=1 Tax=Amaricoccus macauensis TaxID=57001 RepID=A0A840SM07_9RHOB|nr:PQQ-like beta-propeller repeat protein [Amaricoccus macauensis]MBB5223017.1 outer membrane protein assembly factor BamB [Amaricoccus macauensis]